MSLPEQDREWVRSIVKEAITELASALKGYIHETVNSHASHCPNISRVKWLLIGMAMVLGGGVAGIVSSPLGKLITGN